jgi:hypothetical protein
LKDELVSSHFEETASSASLPKRKKSSPKETIVLPKRQGVRVSPRKRGDSFTKWSWSTVKLKRLLLTVRTATRKMKAPQIIP